MFKGTLFAMLVAFAVGMAPPALAQDFPTKTVRFIVPFAPGNGGDIMARVLGEQLSRVWGQPVVIDNVPGAGGVVAAREFVKAPTDGYTYLLGDVGALVINPLLSSKLPYDPVKDMMPITDVMRTPWVFYTSKKTGIKSLADLVAQARASPSKFTYASTGPGAPNYAVAEMFKMRMGIDLTEVPYRDGNQMRVDIVEGTVTLMVSSYASAKPLLDRLQPLAVASRVRDANLPDVPTVKEAIGLEDFEVEAWAMLVGRRGVRQEIVDKVYKDIASVVTRKEVQDKVTAIGMEIRGSSPDEMAKLITLETERYRAVMNRPGVPRN